MSTPPPAPTPKGLERLPGRRLRIAWSDGAVLEYTARGLREACPCATCREKRLAPAAPSTQLTVVPIEETTPVDIAGMRPTGAYAYAIAFTDGHTNGLFTFDLLRSLGSTAGGDRG